MQEGSPWRGDSPAGVRSSHSSELKERTSFCGQLGEKLKPSIHPAKKKKKEKKKYNLSAQPRAKASHLITKAVTSAAKLLVIWKP